MSNCCEEFAVWTDNRHLYPIAAMALKMPLQAAGFDVPQLWFRSAGGDDEIIRVWCKNQGVLPSEIRAGPAACGVVALFPWPTFPCHCAEPLAGLPIPEMNLIIKTDGEQRSLRAECPGNRVGRNFPLGYLFAQRDIPNSDASCFGTNARAQNCEMCRGRTQHHFHDVASRAEFVDNCTCLWMDNLQMCISNAQDSSIGEKGMFFWMGLPNRADKFNRKGGTRHPEKAKKQDKKRFHEKPPNPVRLLLI